MLLIGIICCISPLFVTVVIIPLKNEMFIRFGTDSPHLGLSYFLVIIQILLGGINLFWGIQLMRGRESRKAINNGIILSIFTVFFCMVAMGLMMNLVLTPIYDLTKSF